MKHNIKTIIIIIVLSVSVLLAAIIAAIYADNSDKPHFTDGDSTPCETPYFSEDIEDPTNTVPDSSPNESADQSEEFSGTQESATVTDVSDTITDEVIVTTQPETTSEDTNFIETTVESATETLPEETTAPEETVPETTVHSHAFSDWMIKQSPTCEVEGIGYRLCACGEVEQNPLPAVGHKKKVLAAVKATCLNEGLSEGAICSICDKILKEQIVIPIASCEIKGATCVNCGKFDPSYISLTAPYAGLYKAETLECLYSLSPDVKTPPASLTKMITACVAIEYMPLDYVIKVGTEQSLVPKNSSLCYIYKGHRIKLIDLLTGMLLCSGNDAAYAVAVNVARYAANDSSMSDADAILYFCGLMNDYAKKIGAENTCFKTPDGFDKDGQYSTVSDLAIITAHAMKNETISEITSMHYKRIVFESGQIANWTNTNELINPSSSYYTENVTGFKTGGTENAGKCLSATFEVNGVKYIAIVLGCKDNAARYQNILELINSIN